MPETEPEAVMAKVNADTIKDKEATQHGARGTEDTEPPEPTPIEPPPPLPH